jgi:hyperosmotically inducible periplasmic protein
MFDNAPTARVIADTFRACCHCSVHESAMNHHTAIAAALTVFAVLSTAGCAVMRDQQSVGAYVDDATITTQVKARMLDNPGVAGTSISVETLNGTVMLSGFAKSSTERNAAETIARNVTGVKLVKNEIAIRP